MRGYLTRSGLGVLLGLAGLALGAATFTVAPQAHPAGCATASYASVGPFVAQVEQFKVVTRDHRQHAYVQLHLWRPTGPVKWEDRVRIDGPAWLGRGWRPVDAEWLLRNEYLSDPPGDYLEHPVLGRVPATVHAGEVRAIYEFVWEGPGRADCTANLTYWLPNGEHAVFPALRANGGR